MGIGMTEQVLQPFLGPVMGKITVLLAIILFLQFKPGGIFPSRSRSLDD
jgi:urea transport system permease protein